MPPPHFSSLWYSPTANTRFGLLCSLTSLQGCPKSLLVSISHQRFSRFVPSTSPQMWQEVHRSICKAATENCSPDTHSYWSSFGAPLHSSKPYFKHKHIKWDGIKHLPIANLSGFTLFFQLTKPVKLVEKEIQLLLRFVSDKLVLWPLGIVHRWYFLSCHKCKRWTCKNKPWSSYQDKNLRVSVSSTSQDSVLLAGRLSGS